MKAQADRGRIPDPLSPTFRADQLPERFYPIDDWQIVEDGFHEDLMPRMETVFALANGYLGLRGNFEESRPSYENGTYVNGFHETWPITHAEEAYGFAKTGQTIVNVPDGKVLKLYIDDEPLFLPSAHLHRFRRTLDLKTGVLERELLWELASGKKVEVRSKRMVSFEHRHVALITFEVTLLNDSAPVVISSQLVNRERVPPDEPAEDFDPRRATPISGALVHEVEGCRGERLAFGYSTESSGMTMACGADHQLIVESPSTFTTECNEHFGKVVYTIDAEPGQTIRIDKYLAYHTSTVVPSRELVDRVHRSLDRAMRQGPAELMESQRKYLAGFWEKCDVEIDNGPEVQQAVRWNLFQLAQAGSRAEGVGVAAKGLTGQAYEGHYFWDTEVYSLPFYIYSSPRIARNLLKFRHKMLPQARVRAEQLSQKGALFPWRTINGEEASAYYEAGTAQYHINADIAYALQKYLQVTGDRSILADFGAEILVETARLWVDLGFFKEGTDEFHIHGVTGPDEYTTLVNDNCYTNLMARENLRASARLLRELAEEEPEKYETLVSELDLKPDEIELWDRAAEAMFIPFDDIRGIHPQDANFLDKEIWDFDAMPPDRYPLLLHYHPLVIYRYQVLKQADVVLAMFLLSDDFTQDDKMHNFYYYDPLTTGDSSLSASVQSIIAAEIGDMENAMRYFRRGLFMDLADVAGNAGDGVHVAAAGGVWLNLVYGFGGLRDAGGKLKLEPRLPPEWNRLAFRLHHQDRNVAVEITRGEAILTLTEGSSIPVTISDEEHQLLAGEPVKVPIEPASDLI
jgi:alpha,alpha-trehalose phosphorylase